MERNLNRNEILQENESNRKNSISLSFETSIDEDERKTNALHQYFLQIDDSTSQAIGGGSKQNK